LIAAAVGVFLLVQMFGKAYKEQGNDFTSYLFSASALIHGQNPYATGSMFPYVYPLFLCVVLLPFALVPYWLANLLWFLIGVSAAVASTVIMLRYVAPGVQQKTLLTFSLLTLLILFGVTQNNLLNGQVNFVVILCSVFFYHFLQEGKRSVASFFLACAIALKMTPLIFLFYLLVRGEYRAIGSVVLLTAIFVLAVPMAFAGSATFDFYTLYLHSFLFATVSSTGVHPGGFSLGGIAQQVFGLAGHVGLTLGVLVIVLVPVAYLQLKGRGNRVVESLAFLLYLTGMLLVTPISETHHLAALFLPVGAIAIGLYRGSFRHPLPVFFLLAATIILLLFAKFVFVLNLFAILIIYALLLTCGRDTLARAL
jgi:alpha-1,2-mannosyltransferase